MALVLHSQLNLTGPSAGIAVGDRSISRDKSANKENKESIS